MPIINLDSPILDLKGEPVRRNPQDTAPVALSDLCIEALTATQRANADNPEGKLLRFKLAQRCAKGGEQEFTSKELVFIDEEIGHHTLPVAYGCAHNLLLPEDPE